MFHVKMDTRRQAGGYDGNTQPKCSRAGDFSMFLGKFLTSIEIHKLRLCLF